MNEEAVNGWSLASHQEDCRVRDCQGIDELHRPSEGDLQRGCVASSLPLTTYQANRFVGSSVMYRLQFCWLSHGSANEETPP